jgi:hypothetical protein
MPLQPAGLPCTAHETVIGRQNIVYPTEVQDQYSKYVQRFLTSKLNTVTLSSTTVIGSRVVNLQSGHQVVAGNMLCLFDDLWSYQGTVVNVATDQITVDAPLDHTFGPSTTESWRTTRNMNVNGAVTPAIFGIHPPRKEDWDINQLELTMVSNVAMDSAKFGSLTALTNGLVCRINDGTIRNLFVAHTNGELAVFSDARYDDKAPSGSYGYAVRKTFNSQSQAGVTVRICGENRERFEAIVQDDLSSLLVFFIMVRGHSVIH